MNIFDGSASKVYRRIFMTTLDAVLSEVLKRLEAAGGKAWIAPDAPDYAKAAFLEALIDCPDRKKAIER
jgi:hypothetical protein